MAAASAHSAKSRGPSPCERSREYVAVDAVPRKVEYNACAAACTATAFHRAIANSKRPCDIID